MSREKQIEEMAFNLIMATSPLGVKDLTKQFDYATVAKDLYELYGYRKQSEGEWLCYDVLHDDDGDWARYTCSQCKYFTDSYYLHIRDLYNFCPNCGAKMKGE